jgi:hypothetical protein
MIPEILEPVMNFPAGGAESQFFSVRGLRSDEYGLVFERRVTKK